MDSVKDALHPIVASAYTAKICDVLVGLAAKKGCTQRKCTGNVSTFN